MNDEFVMGVNSVRELVKHAPRRMVKLYVAQEKSLGRKSDIVDSCKKKNISVQILSFERLTKLVNSDSHQGVIAQVNPRQYLSTKEFLSKQEKEKSTVLMLDQIFDPQNFGALLRSAECFGVDAVIFSKNRGSEITPVTTKSSCGASEILPLLRVSNLAETVSEFQKAGYEAVVSLLDPNSQDLNHFKFSDKTLLIMGSEGEGIQPLICKRADRSVYIPMFGQIQSLNVAQACAVMLYAATSPMQ
ncbi:23S rRNA (guanosine(2251)-2'-O)-methyltransferase RlmB [Patescibacteria group bacterium]|nr:23S rRNA (guanosine(2251)-2'-O)-methyltransferase RlmB [Patescibacteria group bacterium]